jgi:hypothetical protein
LSHEKEHNGRTKSIKIKNNLNKLLEKNKNKILKRKCLKYRIYWHALGDAHHNRQTIPIDHNQRTLEIKQEKSNETDQIGGQNEEGSKACLVENSTRKTKHIKSINPYNIKSIKKANNFLRKAFLDPSNLKFNEQTEMLKMKTGLKSTLDEDVESIEKRLDFTYETRKKFELKRQAFENIHNPKLFPENYRTLGEILSDKTAYISLRESLNKSIGSIGNRGPYTEEAPTYRMSYIEKEEEETTSGFSSDSSFIFDYDNDDEDIQILDFVPGDKSSTIKPQYDKKFTVDEDAPLIVID